MNAEQKHDPNVVNFSPENRAHDGEVEEAGKVDRIRDILFGSQMRDYDGRFQRLDERLAREAAEAAMTSSGASKVSRISSRRRCSR